MSYSVSLDDYAMTDVSNFVRILDVIELRPKRTTNTQERLGAPGSVVTRDHINCRQVRVQFVLLTSDPVERTAALSAISAWAMQGKCLKIGDRPGQQLQVICTEDPLTMSKRKWTEACEVTFTAFSVPFWEDVTPMEASVSGITEGTASIFVPGNVEQVPLSCKVTPTAGTLTALTIAANGAEMAFSGLAVPAGKTLDIDYVEGFLTARWTADDGTVTPCLKHRSGVEVIPLYTRQQNTVSIQADTAADVTICARGWYW